MLGTPAGRSDANQLEQLASTAGDISRSLTSGASSGIADLARQLKLLLPPDVLSRFPDLDRMTSILAASSSVGRTAPQTVKNLIPGVDLGGIVSTIASSLIPGFGGSAVALGIGLLAHFFGRETSRARVREHRDGGNLDL